MAAHDFPACPYLVAVTFFTLAAVRELIKTFPR